MGGKCEHCGREHNLIERLAEEPMPTEEELYDLAELFKIFGDSTRIKILYERDRNRADAEHDAELDLASAARAQAEPAG